jgi:hypothetical protein
LAEMVDDVQQVLREQIAAGEARIAELDEDLGLGAQRIAELEAKTKTTLTGAQFLALVVIIPLLGAFVILGVLIVWKTTNSPAEVAPHLDLILVAYAIFSNAVSAVVGAVVGGMSAAKKEEA